MWMWGRKPVTEGCSEPDACGKWITYRFSVSHSLFRGGKCSHTHTQVRHSKDKGTHDAALSDCKMAVVNPVT